MCKALAEIMKPELDEAFDNGFNNGFNNGYKEGFDCAKNDGKILAFRNMIKEGMSRELAQKCTELSDQLVEKVLAEI
jgi:flagellar biosynthesis/type III secretory pathway protein FliH